MSCEYCEKRYEKPVKEMENGANLWVEKKNECLTVQLRDGDLTYFAKFCPMCGEPLKEER